VALVLDTGVLYAALDARDADHSACASVISQTNEPLVIPGPVLVEVDHWLRKNASVDVWLRLCEAIAAGAYSIYNLAAEDLLFAVRLQVKYRSLPLDFVDASVMATCEALGETKVATLDRRDFGVVRTSKKRAWTIVP
jgi:uncharacterized protein